MSSNPTSDTPKEQQTAPATHQQPAEVPVTIEPTTPVGSPNFGPPVATGMAHSTATPEAAQVSATGGAGASMAPTRLASDSTKKSPCTLEELADQAVIEYLRKKGMDTAVFELTQILKQQGKTMSICDEGPKLTIPKEAPKAATPKDANYKSELACFTTMEQLDDDDRKSILSNATGGGFGYDRDAASPVVQWGVPDKTTCSATTEGLADRMGVDEAQSLMDALTSFQLWVINLPELGGLQTKTENSILKSQQLIKNNKHQGGAALSSVIETLAKPRGNSNDASNADLSDTLFNLPPSAKPELFAVAFALLVHTYCELLEVGIESTAVAVRDTFKCIYEPLYAKEYADLYQCNTTEDMMRLNSHNAQHMEALANLNGVLVNVANFQLKRDELSNAPDGAMDTSTKTAKQAKLQEYERTISMLQQKYNELSQRASMAFHKMHDLPFLRRARAVRWQLSISTATYGLLSSFLNAADTSLLAMTALLQTKCELHVEHRDPLPFTPACVLDNMGTSGETKLQLNNSKINWAAPMRRQQDELAYREKLPFPKYHIEDEYFDETKAKEGRKVVEFNRALLVNGFRRLEALERKQEYEVLPKLKVAKEDYHQHASSRETANPLEPTILMSTLCSNVVGPATRQPASSSSAAANRNQLIDTAAMWEESGIGLCCAKICPPDGRQVAVGCNDAAVRIWNLMDAKSGREPAQVLLGHKNGFPVFDVSWNRDGRTLLSAAGDGSMRLWDTRAVGHFGETASIKQYSSPTKKSKAAGAATAAAELEDMNVPGFKAEGAAENASGAALAVYRGHAPSTPIWSVAFAPCGYYFASAGADATARLWTTDREVPVRLFTGHTSMIVNCVDWHPNCNYIITGSEDRTARIWDVHSGRTVRLLNGCLSGVNAVKISPCGKYAACADGGGILHIWDIGTGRKVTEFWNKLFEKGGRPNFSMSMIHTISFSACGSGLATGGDDCYIRIWDISQETIGKSPIVDTPVMMFPTRQAIIMDLDYNKRNLLLMVGKFATPLPSPVLIPE